jgi:hypothetical protein
MENNNKLIAEFMEWTLDDKDLNSYRKYNGSIFKYSLLSNFKYHTDWNWLMPVVERIELDMGFDVYIHYNNCTITDGENAFENEAEPNQKIYATYQSVIEFINWYNNKQ